jgi:hypothetical protein
MVLAQGFENHSRYELDNRGALGEERRLVRIAFCRVNGRFQSPVVNGRPPARRNSDGRAANISSGQNLRRPGGQFKIFFFSVTIL